MLIIFPENFKDYQNQFLNNQL